MPDLVQVRWMIRRDMPQVLAIEDASFDVPWFEDDFLACLRQRNCIGMVAERSDDIVGFMIYELHKAHLHILNFAVDPLMRRRGVGSAMVVKLIMKLSLTRRTSIVLEVRETNLAAQMFFRAAGMRAVAILPEHYEDDSTAYRMCYRIDGEPETEWRPRNRLTQYLRGDIA